jgi:endo-1,4-beta-D-glucanase Y
MTPTTIIFILIAIVGTIVILVIRDIKKDRQRSSDSPPEPVEAKRPFPQSQPPGEKLLRPNHVTQDDINQVITAYYQKWKERFFIPEDEPDRSFIVCRSTRHRLGYRLMATSEGQGFGMLIMALIYPHDPFAKQNFDALFEFCKAHPSLNSASLMSWQAQANAFLPSLLDSATDGDMDIAYALLLADQQWGSDGKIDYLAEAKKIIKALEKECVHHTSHHMLLGNWVKDNRPTYYNGTRSSDFMPGHFLAFAEVGNQPLWQQIYQRERDLLLAFSEAHSPETGFLPDFLVDLNDTPRSAPPGYLEREDDSHFGFNACRLPLRMGIGYLHSGDPSLLPLLKRNSHWVEKATHGKPEDIAAGYTLTGETLQKGSSMAFTAPLAVAAACCPDSQMWLNALWDELVSQPVDNNSYYASTLQLLSMLALSGNWWDPRNPQPEQDHEEQHE